MNNWAELCGTAKIGNGLSNQHPRSLEATVNAARWWLPAALVLLPLQRPSAAQQQTLGAPVMQIRVPDPSYYVAVAAFHRGEIRDALKHFESEARGGVKTSTGSFIDSACYHTMVGESYYRLGDTARALERFNAALRLSAAFPQWLLRIRFQGSAVRPWTPTSLPPWGRSPRQPAMVRIKEGLPFAVGNLNNNDIIQRGGQVSHAQYWSVDAVEIVRCLALALRRRAEILGPLSNFDPLSKQMLALLNQGGAAPNHWSESLVDLQLGLALVAMEQLDQAEKVLMRAATLKGTNDYRLSSIAMLELGKLAERKGDLVTAGQFYLEASYSAYHYENWGVVEEALRRGLRAHLTSSVGGFYAPLGLAAKWPKLRREFRPLGASIAVDAAENLALLGELDRASLSLKEAAKILLGRSGRDLQGGQLEARFHWVTALMHFIEGNINDGMTAANAAVAIQTRASAKQYQIFLVRQEASSGEQLSGITARRTLQLFDRLLREPTPEAWTTSPLDTLTSLIVPQDETYAAFLAAASNRKETELSWKIAEQYRRHVFFRSLPLGGRLLALRTLLETPTTEMSPQQTIQREDLLTQFPRYVENSRQITEIRKELLQTGLQDDLQQEQQQQLKQLAALGISQEVLLHEMAVRRFPAEFIYPPPLPNLEVVQAALEPRQAVLAFYGDGNTYHGLLLNRDRYATWTTASSQVVHQGLADFLRTMGNHGANAELSWQELGSDTWRTAGDKLLQLIVDQDQVDLSRDIDELVIVPAGLLWYLPFEALPLGGSTDKTLLQQVKLRYVPTLSLVTVKRSRPHVPGRLQIVAGELFKRNEPVDAASLISSLQRQDPSTSAFPAETNAPVTAVRSILERLVVWDDIEDETGEPYGWNPISVRSRRQQANLLDWIALPSGHPRLLVLPGYHTAAERGLRPNRNQSPTGDEIFLPVTALMAGGTDTILLSRWRTGGQTSFDLIREFVQELPYTSASDAWQRSVQLAASNPLDSAMEPRLKKHPEGASQQLADHPLFWSGYLLFDLAGSLPEEPADNDASLRVGEGIEAAAR